MCVSEGQAEKDEGGDRHRNRSREEGREGLGAGLVAGLEISRSTREFKNELNYGSKERQALNLLC